MLANATGVPFGDTGVVLRLAPPPVGGIVELSAGAGPPADASGSGSAASDYAAPVAVGVAAAIALTAGFWYTRRRRLR